MFTLSGAPDRHAICSARRANVLQNTAGACAVHRSLELVLCSSQHVVGGAQVATRSSPRWIRHHPFHGWLQAHAFEHALAVRTHNVRFRMAILARRTWRLNVRGWHGNIHHLFVRQDSQKHAPEEQSSRLRFDDCLHGGKHARRQRSQQNDAAHVLGNELRRFDEPIQNLTNFVFPNLFDHGSQLESVRRDVIGHSDHLLNLLCH